MRCHLSACYQLAERLLRVGGRRAGKGKVTPLGRRLALSGKTVTFHLQFSTGYGARAAGVRLVGPRPGRRQPVCGSRLAAAAPVLARLSGGWAGLDIAGHRPMKKVNTDDG